VSGRNNYPEKERNKAEEEIKNILNEKNELTSIIKEKEKKV
jgi:hypothetical protein